MINNNINNGTGWILAHWEGGGGKGQQTLQKLQVLIVLHAIEPLEAKFWVSILIYFQQSIFWSKYSQKNRSHNDLVGDVSLGHKWRAKTRSMGRVKPHRTEKTPKLWPKVASLECLSCDRTVRSQILGSNFDLSKHFLIFLIKIPTKMFRAFNVLVRRYFLGHKWRAYEERKLAQWEGGSRTGQKTHKTLAKCCESLGHPKPNFWPQWSQIQQLPWRTATLDPHLHASLISNKSK